MNTAGPCRCGLAPELATDDQGREFPRCPGCGHRAAAHVTLAASIAYWNRANQVSVVCLGCGHPPRLVYSERRRRWACRCTGCGYQAADLPEDQAAICAWSMENRPRDGHVLSLWHEKKRRQVAAQQRKERC